MTNNDRHLGWIFEVLGGELTNAQNPERIPLLSFEIDTRIGFGPDAVFIALKGKNFEGHNYIEDAIKKGVNAVIVSRKIPNLKIPCLVVPDTLVALQRIAHAWRKKMTCKVVAITGSNGKTIVKDLLASMLSTLGTTYRSPGSFNSQVGVALSLLEIRPKHSFAVIEAGISKPGEMENLEKMILPDAGIWTNVGDAHLHGLGSREGIAQEKMLLFKHCKGPVVFPRDDAFIHALQENFSKKLSVNIEFLDAQHFNLDHQKYTILMPGQHNQINAGLAAKMAIEMGAERRDVYESIRLFRSADLRLEMHTTLSGITLLNDTYNSDPTSMRAALAALNYYGSGHRRIAILGDMLDLGVFSEDAHRQIGREAAKVVDILFIVGHFSKSVRKGAIEGGLQPESIFEYETINALSEVLERELEGGDYLLFKASRALALDTLTEQLFESVASTRLEINLDQVATNVHHLQKKIGPGTKILAVIKSFAYGSDSIRIAQTLIHNGVNGFVVAFPNEAEPLRRRLIRVPILVTNVVMSEVDKISKYNLEAVVSRKDIVDALAKSSPETIKVHVEIDTGMNRLGVKASDAIDFIHYILKKKNIKLAGIMTHLVAADDPSQDGFTRIQINEFENIINTLTNKGVDCGVIHIANTAGAIRFPESRRDAVRVGIGIYGFLPTSSIEARVQPALRMSTRIIDIREVNEGESIGYGRSYFAKRGMRVATIACGYNDGFPRFMSNGGEVLIGGKRGKVVGNVCMDVSMVDITDIPEVKLGDEVVIFGKQVDEYISVEEIAKRGNTINYEILTGISPRVKRIFLRK